MLCVEDLARQHENTSMASSCHHLTFCHDVSKHNELGTLECCHLCPPTGTEVAFSCCAVHVLINDGSTKVSVSVEMYRMHMSYPSSIMLVKRLHQSTVTLARTRNHAWPLLIWLLCMRMRVATTHPASTDTPCHSH